METIETMETIYPHCAGLDVHGSTELAEVKESVYACVRHMSPDGKVRQEVRDFGTSTRSLLELLDWLTSEGVTHAAMESTGVYWHPVWNVLEDRLTVMVVNARHVKQVPGRKTDVKDCQWIAQLLQHGLLKASFIPDRPQRELRDLTRQRAQLIQEKARVANRIQKVLESANIKLASVASDVPGVSGREMIRALIDGNKTPEQMADLARRRLREKIPALREALSGKVTDHHGSTELAEVRFVLRQLLGQVEHLEGQVEAFDRRVEQAMRPFETSAVSMLDKVPGIDARAAQNIIAEIGTDMTRFPSAAHLCSWAGICPGNHTSGGKRKRGATADGNRWLKRTLMQCAWAASRTRGSYFQAQYRRLAARKGNKRAAVAVAHSQLATIYHMLRDGTEYQDLGSDHLDNLAEARRTKQFVKGLERLGYRVIIEKAA